MTESLNQHKLLIQLVVGKNLKMSSWISKMHLRSQMNYLSTQMQPKTNLIIFGILLSKFISHWIITNYIWTIYVPSFHCIRLMTFVRIDGVFFFFFCWNTGLNSLCLALNQYFMLNLLRMLHMLFWMTYV